MRFLLLCALALTAVAAAPSKSQRLPGGSETTIDQYPYTTTIIRTIGAIMLQVCGGTIVNNRSVLTTASCFSSGYVYEWSTRVGSSYSGSDGSVFNFGRIFIHPDYNRLIMENNMAIAHIIGAFSFSDSVAPAAIAGPNYNVADEEPLWAVGWGSRLLDGRLRHLEIQTINQEVCKNNYAEIDYVITDDMFCAGVPDATGVGQCGGDTGCPVIHNNVVVGVTSWSVFCGNPRYPVVKSRVSTFSTWIQEHA